VVVPVAVAEDVAVRPPDPEAVEELLCDAVILQQREGRAERSLIRLAGSDRRFEGALGELACNTHVVVPVAVVEDVAVKPADPEAVDELVCVAVILHLWRAREGC